MDRRPGPDDGARRGRGRSAADAAARGVAGRAIRRQRGVRPAVQHAGQEIRTALVVSLPPRWFKARRSTLTVTYAGRLEPQTLDRETIGARADSEDRRAGRRCSLRRAGTELSCTATGATGIRGRRPATTRRRRSASRCPTVSACVASGEREAASPVSCLPEIRRRAARRTCSTPFSRCGIWRSS